MFLKFLIILELRWIKHIIALGLRYYLYLKYSQRKQLHRHTVVHTVGQKHVTCNSKAEPGPNPGPLPSGTCQIPHATKYTQLESRWLHCHIFSCPLSTWIKFVCFFFQGFVAMWFLQIQLNLLLFSAVCCWYCAHYARRDLLLPSNNLDCIRPHAVDWSSFQFTSSSSVCTSACRSMLWLWHVRHHSSSKFKINVDVIGLSNCQSPSRTSA